MMRRPPYSVRRDGYDDGNDNGYTNALDYRLEAEAYRYEITRRNSFYFF